MADVIERDIDNVRYSFETQEFFQRQLEESVNSLINKNNVETDKVFHMVYVLGVIYGRY
jgi:hypothetical protein